MLTPASPPKASPLSFNKTRLYFGWLFSFMASNESEKRAFEPRFYQPNERRSNEQIQMPKRKAAAVEDSHAPLTQRGMRPIPSFLRTRANHGSRDPGIEDRPPFRCCDHGSC